MRTSTHRRKAVTVAVLVAAASVLVPAQPASASVDQDAIFLASKTSDQVVVLAGGERVSVDAHPTAKVLAGHFTSTAGAQAFLYNPGFGPDGLLDVTRDGDGLESQLTSMPVGGSFQPFVADLDRDGRDDIFWYAPGTARDYVWFFEQDGSVTSVPMAVDAAAQPIPVLVDGINAEPDHQGILWYGAGSRPDSWWMFSGRSAVARRVSIAGSYRVVVGNFRTTSYGHSQEQVLFYDPTGGRSALWTFHRGDGEHRSDPYSSPGRNYTPVVTKAGMHGGDFAYWYGPGPNPEQVSFWNGAELTHGDMPPVNGTYRVLRDAQGRSGAEEVIFLSEGTTARTMQLAPEHTPALGTVTAITGLPPAPHGASTWFEEPVE
ncbi:MAG: hypothetical protein JWO77_2560 [Ilumatobacteraceae bacterium]|nr:hypothetical protein [Ilumatobacteraceae bacterium]